MRIYHTPELFSSQTGYKAGITYANRDTININGSITGLNLGDNTGVSESEIHENFNKFSEETGLKKHNLALAEQVHGSKIEIVSEPGFYKDVDGFVTSTENLAIAVKVADCAAVLLADPSTHIHAAVHAGWRGAAADILPNAISKMKSLGADMSETVAYISPCISLQHFEVGEEVASQFDAAFINRNIGKKPHLDLKSFLNHQLSEEGILQQKIEIDPRCSIEDSRFYSFRRERQQAGRMLAFIMFRRN